MLILIYKKTNKFRNITHFTKILPHKIQRQQKPRMSVLSHTSAAFNLPAISLIRQNAANVRTVQIPSCSPRTFFSPRTRAHAPCSTGTWQRRLRLHPRGLLRKPRACALILRSVIIPSGTAYIERLIKPFRNLGIIIPRKILFLKINRAVLLKCYSVKRQ